MRREIDRCERQIDKAMEKLEKTGWLYRDGHITINGESLCPKDLILVLWRLKNRHVHSKYRERFTHCLDVSILFHREYLLAAENLLKSIPGAKMPRRPKIISKILGEKKSA